ncbi:MAG: ABC transporter ATP-binding protein [Acidiferrobacterales bacterium]|nr:ABC transporter ATP-binding protein [Acidiferrobacterales bacterium]
MLRVVDISKSFGGANRRAVLDAVNLEISAGEYIAVMGESGIGKSTMLNIIAGLEAPDAGQVMFDGVNLGQLPENTLTRLRREQMGFVFQAFYVLPYLSVAQNVELPLALLRTDAASSRARINEMLHAVGLGSRGDSMPRELSGGELQRVAIARALVHRPKVVLADEPTGNLDPDTAGQILSLLKTQIKENGAAGILVTHSPDAARTADKTYKLTSAGLVEQIDKH